MVSDISYRAANSVMQQDPLSMLLEKAQKMNASRRETRKNKLLSPNPRNGNIDLSGRLPSLRPKSSIRPSMIEEVVPKKSVVPSKKV